MSVLYCHAVSNTDIGSEGDCVLWRIQYDSDVDTLWCRGSGSGWSQQAFRDDIQQLLDPLHAQCAAPPLLTPDSKVATLCLSFKMHEAPHILHSLLLCLWDIAWVACALPVSVWPLTAEAALWTWGAARCEDRRALCARDIRPQEEAAGGVGRRVGHSACPERAPAGQVRAPPWLRQAPQR